MRKTVLFLLPLACLMAEQKKSTSKPTANAVKQTAPKATGSDSAINPPAGAVEIEPRVWRYTDKAGKTWLYRPTPFGLSRVEEKSVAAAAADAPAPSTAQVVPVYVKAVDLGDTVRFEAPSPMGPRVWTVKKSQLTGEESSWLERSKSAADAAKATRK